MKELQKCIVPDDKFIHVTFWKCTCAATRPGDHVAIVGANTELGAWNANASIRLQTSRDSWPLWWSLEPCCVVGEDLEFKCIISKPNGNFLWEPVASNRHAVLGGQDCVIIECHWGDGCSTKVIKPGINNSTVKHHKDGSHHIGKTRRRPHKLQKSSFVIANSIPIASRYKIYGTIGTGTWGAVHVAEEIETSTRRAVKQIPLCYLDDISKIRQEIEIMKKLDHPNIVRLVETFEDDTNLYLVMEYCSGGELFERLASEGSFSEARAADMMQQMLVSVAYCHSKGIVHRDLKPENFLFSSESKDSKLKLTDFGLATEFKPGEQLHTRAGTPYYVSPQVLEGRYGPECDTWSAGVIMFILLCGYPPFNGANDRVIMHRVRLGNYTFPDKEWIRITSQAKSLIAKLLERNPQRRITAEQALKDPWFTLFQLHCDVSKTLGIDILSKFRRFQGLSRLRRLALTVIAQHLDDKELADLQQIFYKLDSRKDGVLTTDEIKQGLESHGEKLPMDHALDDILHIVEATGTGTVDYTEFLAACLHKSQYIREGACRAAFRILDIHGKGRIRKEELQQVFEMAGDLEADPLAELREADTDGNGEIDFEEFSELMRRVPSLSLVTEDSVLLMRKTASRGCSSIAESPLH